VDRCGMCQMIIKARRGKNCLHFIEVEVKEVWKETQNEEIVVRAR